ncbi:MAG: PBP1A family penicillin-binding protein [Verrucomicrobiota bacterium]
MPSRQNHNEPRVRTAASARPGFFSLLFFWPFHLVTFLTRRLRLFPKILFRLAGYPAAFASYGILLFALVYGWRASEFDLNRLHAMPERTIVRDRMGEEVGRIHGEKRSIVPLHQVSEHFRKAIIAREDERFYHHFAFDILGIGRAVMKNLEGKREGASTITQQLASDIFQLKEGEKRGQTTRQIDRKLLEIALAIRIEWALEKDEILEAYINQINWGRQIRGVSEASRIYFEKHPSELTLSQSALLAGIVRGPDSFNPFKSIEKATRERDTTLDRMVAAEILTKEEAEAAKKDKIIVRPAGRRDSKESYAMDAIRRELDIILEKENIELGGLEIITTIDKRMQETAEAALEKKLASVEKYSGYDHQTRTAWQKKPEEERSEPAYIQGAAAVLENRTGAVLAIVGGRDASESRFNRATDAYRQIGSIFKPFVYMAAFDAGLGPGSLVDDSPIQPGEIRGGGRWRPKNSDGSYGGAMPAAYGLIRSRNTMSVRVGNFAGIKALKDLVARAGFDTPMPAKPTSFLGAWEATPLEVASAYTIFPNSGERPRPYLISQIKDRRGNILFRNLPLPYRIADEHSARSVSRILTEVATRGTASSVKRLGFDKPCAGKTGTTNDYKDAWFAGYTSTLTCAVWVGLDTPKTTIHRGFGSTLALPIWVDIMKTAHRLGYKAGKLGVQGKVVSAELCRLSGKRSTAGCREAGTTFMDIVSADVAPDGNDFCPIHPAKAIAVDPNAKPADNSPESAQPPRARVVGPDPNAPAAEPALRALPVEDEFVDDPDPPLRALPVE